MSGSVLHTLLGRDAYALLRNPQARSAAGNEWNAYLWGLQGGDLYYAPSRVPGYTLNKLGLSFHLLKTAETFSAMCEYLQRIRTERPGEYTAMRAYVMGYLGHYALDSQIHSYVFPMEREYRRAHPDYDEAREGGLHGRLEGGIEWILFHCRKRPGETMKDVTAPYSMTEGFKEALRRFYLILSDSLFGIDASAEPIELCIDCCFQGFQYGPKEEDLFIEDQMNFLHRKWEVYDSPGLFLCSSAPELYENAMREAAGLMDELITCLEGSDAFHPQIERNCSYWKYEDPTWFREMYQF